MKLFFQLGLLALLALSVEPRRRRGKRAVEELSVFEPQWLAARGRGARGRGRVIRQYVERQGVCKTKDGPTAGGKACVFPFSFDGVTYNGCPSWPADASETWCSTKVDTAGNHVTGGGNFGFCSADCPSNTESSEAVDCGACIAEFAADGGCECLLQFLMDHTACDVAALIPEGCSTCSHDAVGHCAA